MDERKQMQLDRWIHNFSDRCQHSQRNCYERCEIIFFDTLNMLHIATYTQHSLLSDTRYEDPYIRLYIYVHILICLYISMHILTPYWCFISRQGLPILFILASTQLCSYTCLFFSRAIAYQLKSGPFDEVRMNAK